MEECTQPCGSREEDTVTVDDDAGVVGVGLRVAAAAAAAG
jgi:hypothetical protein